MRIRIVTEGASDAGLSSAQRLRNTPMTNTVKIQIAIGLALLALGALLAFTQHNDNVRMAGAIVAALGLVFTRRALRGVKWRRDKR